MKEEPLIGKTEYFPISDGGDNLRRIPMHNDEDIKSAVIYHHKLETLMLLAYNECHITLLELDFLRFEAVKDNFKDVL